MVTNRTVAKAFVEKREARAKHLFTDGKTIWSYGRHFPIAVWNENGIAFITTDRYSKTTSRHHSYIRQALAAEGIQAEPAGLQRIKEISEQAERIRA